MEDENRQEKSEHSPSEKRPPGGGGNHLWYLLVAGVATILLVNLLTSKAQVEITYGALVRLIDQGNPTHNPNAAIKVPEGTDSHRQTVRYSDLADLQIGPEEITGTVTRQVIAPQEGEPELKMQFRTARRGLANDNNALFTRLRDKGFDECAQSLRPARLDRWRRS